MHLNVSVQVPSAHVEARARPGCLLLLPSASLAWERSDIDPEFAILPSWPASEPSTCLCPPVLLWQVQGHSPTFYIGARDLNSSALTHRTVSPALIVSVICIYLYFHTCHSVYVDRVQRAACKSWFSPCTVWILGTQICRRVGHCLNPLRYLALAFMFLR